MPVNPYPCFVQLLYKIALPVPARNQSSLVRAALTAFFAIDGFIFASWAVRIPAVKAAVGASPAALGIALLGASGGAIATMTLTGALCRRLGSARVVVLGCAWLSLALLLPALARSALALGLSLVVFGIGYGGLNVAMNSLAVDLLAVLRRPVMPSFHAAWSLGGLAGSALGGLAAAVLSPLPHFALVCLLGLLVTVTCGRVILVHPVPVAHPVPETRHGAGDAGPDQGPGPAAGSARVWRTVALLGVIALCSTYGEGAISDWGALHLREDLGAAAGLAAAGYAAFALAEASGRLAGSWLLGRFGQTRLLVGGAILTCAGMLAAALSPVLPLALAGFALAGLGVANAFPTAMSRVGALAGPHGVAAASTFGYAGFLLGPPLIGFLSGALSLRVALTTVAVLAVVAMALARAAAPGSPDPRLTRQGKPGPRLRQHVGGQAGLGRRHAEVGGPAVGHGEQAADPARDGVFGQRRVGQLAELLQRRLPVGHPQPPGHHQVLRGIGTEDLQGALHPGTRRHRGPRRAPQVSVVEVRQPVGGRPHLAPHPALLPGQHAVVGAKPGQHRRDRLAVADHHPVHAADLPRLGRDLHPPRGADQRQRGLRSRAGNLKGHRPARLGQRPVHQEGAAPGGLAVADAARHHLPRQSPHRAAEAVDQTGLPGQAVAALRHPDHVAVALAQPAWRQHQQLRGLPEDLGD
jgi:MFS family permease